MRDPAEVPQHEIVPPDLDEELPESGTTFAVPAPDRERMYGEFDGIPPQAATARNMANRRRVIE